MNHFSHLLTTVVRNSLRAFAALVMLFAAASPHALATQGPQSGDKCAGFIANNAAAASVCYQVCSREELQFAGNWSNDRRHPPVAACISGGKGPSVCGCVSANSAAQSPSATAPAPDATKGANVVMATFSNGASFVNYAGATWYELRANGDVAATYGEIKRDEWSVYLHDNTRKVNMQIDLWKKDLVRWDANNNHSVLAKVTMAYSRKDAPSSFQQAARRPLVPYRVLFFANQGAARKFVMDFAEEDFRRRALAKGLTPNQLWYELKKGSRLAVQLRTTPGFNAEKIGAWGRVWGPEGPEKGIVECDGVMQLGPNCPTATTLHQRVLSCRGDGCKNGYPERNVMNEVLAEIHRSPMVQVAAGLNILCGVGCGAAAAFKDPDTWVGKDGAFTKTMEDFVPGGGLVTAIFHGAAGHPEYARAAAVQGVVSGAFAIAIVVTGGAASPAVGTAAAVVLGGSGAITQSMALSALRGEQIKSSVFYDGLEGAVSELPGLAGVMGGTMAGEMAP